jgi:flagellar assembly protein FliH
VEGGFGGVAAEASVGVAESSVRLAEGRPRLDGFERGRREGFDAGLLAAEEEQRRLVHEREARLTTVLAALDAAVRTAGDAYARAVVSLEDRITAVAFQVTEALLQRELELANEPGREAVARALGLAAGLGPMRVRLHPDDVATVGDPDLLATGHELTIVADAALAPGDCIAEVGASEIDASLRSALERVRRVLVADRRATT